MNAPAICSLVILMLSMKLHQSNAAPVSATPASQQNTTTDANIRIRRSYDAPIYNAYSTYSAIPVPAPMYIQPQMPYNAYPQQSYEQPSYQQQPYQQPYEQPSYQQPQPYQQPYEQPSYQQQPYEQPSYQQPQPYHQPYEQPSYQPQQPYQPMPSYPQPSIYG